jgi:hypothetical protein
MRRTVSNRSYAPYGTFGVMPHLDMGRAVGGTFGLRVQWCRRQN